MSDNNQTQFKMEGQPAFPIEDTETEDSADSSSVEETSEEETQSVEGEESSNEEERPDTKTDFHEHPRWKEREDDWKSKFNEQEKRHLEEVEKLRTEVLEKLNTSSKDDEDVEIPSWFGSDDKELYKAFQRDLDTRLQSVREEAKKEVFNEMQSKTQAEQESIERATEYMNSEIEAIESDPSLNPNKGKIDKNKLLKYVLDKELVDTQGRWNYRAGWELMQAGVENTKKAELTEKKKLASSTTSEKKSETEKPTYATPETFENPALRPW